MPEGIPEIQLHQETSRAACRSLLIAAALVTCSFFVLGYSAVFLPDYMAEKWPAFSRFKEGAEITLCLLALLAGTASYALWDMLKDKVEELE